MYYGLEPGWLGVSFGLRNCYVRIIIARFKLILLVNYNSNVIDMEHIISSCIKYMMLSIQRNYYGITAIYQREYFNLFN